MKPFRSLARLACVASLVVAGAAHAGIAVYTSRAAFESAITVGQVVDFESAFSFSNTSITFGDATFVSTDGTGVHRTEAPSFGGTSTRLAAQNSGGIRIDLAAGHFALGMDVGELFGATIGDFVVTGGSGLTTSAAVGYFGPTPTFIGFISTDEIGSVQFDITQLTGHRFETIDNVTLDAAGGGGGGQAPEPGSLALLGVALLSLRTLRDRNKR